MTDLLLVVDFDGTVYRGDAPVRDYARRVAAALRPGRGPRRYLDAIERYLRSAWPPRPAASTDTVEAAALREAVDSWGAVLSLARPPLRRCGAEVLGPAFAGPASEMLDPACALELVTPLMDTLADLRGDARVVLVTNSPPAACAAARPAGRAGGLRRHRGRRGQAGRAAPVPAAPRSARTSRARPWRLFSIGDHYRNDIEPAVEIGAAAGTSTASAAPTARPPPAPPGAEDLLPVLRAWARDPEGGTRRGALAGRGGRG